MAKIGSDKRRSVSGVHSQSINLGLVAGASAMVGVFVMASGAANQAAIPPESVAGGLRTNFLIAASINMAIRLSTASSLVSANGCGA